MTPDSEQCPLHSGIEAKLKQMCTMQNDCKTRQATCDGWFKQVDSKIEVRITMRLFYCLVGVLVIVCSALFVQQGKTNDLITQTNMEMVGIQSDLKHLNKTVEEMHDDIERYHGKATAYIDEDRQ